MTGPWQVIFTVVGVLGATYLAVARRTFDLPALAFFGACFYFLPGFVGFVGHAEGLRVYPVAIEGETYAVMTLVLVAIGITALLSDALGRAHSLPVMPGDAFLRSAAWVASGLGAIGMVLTLITVGAGLFSADKFGLLESLNRWHLLWTSSATIAVVLAFALRSSVLMTIGAILLLINLYIGFRVDLVIALVGVAAYWLMSQKAGRLIAKWRFIGGIVFAGLLLFVLKYVLVALQLMDVDLLLSQLRNPEAFKFIFLYSEPFIAQGTLNEVVRQDFWVGPGHLGEIIYLAVPFANELGAPAQGFNALFQPTLFSSVTGYGLGSNIWAEMLASGGWPLLVVFVMLFCATLLAGDRMLRRAAPSLAAPGVVILVYWAFYIHRNDLLYQLTLTRRVLLVAVLIIAGALLVRIVAVALKSLSGSTGTLGRRGEPGWLGPASR